MHTNNLRRQKQFHLAEFCFDYLCFQLTPLIPAAPINGGSAVTAMPPIGVNPQSLTSPILGDSTSLSNNETATPLIRGLGDEMVPVNGKYIVKVSIEGKQYFREATRREITEYRSNPPLFGASSVEAHIWSLNRSSEKSTAAVTDQLLKRLQGAQISMKGNKIVVNGKENTIEKMVLGGGRTLVFKDGAFELHLDDGRFAKLPEGSTVVPGKNGTVITPTDGGTEGRTIEDYFKKVALSEIDKDTNYVMSPNGQAVYKVTQRDAEGKAIKLTAVKDIAELSSIDGGGKGIIKTITSLSSAFNGPEPKSDFGKEPVKASANEGGNNAGDFSNVNFSNNPQKLKKLIEFLDINNTQPIPASINLHGANLEGVDLSKVNLKEADLTKANLTGAVLSTANLSGAIMTEAILFKADLSGANLRKAYLYGANLNFANCKNANLRFTNLEYASLILTNLNGANLTGANLSNSGPEIDRAHPRGDYIIDEDN